MSTDALIEALLRAGRLRVDAQTGRVWVYLTQKKQWIEKRAALKPGSGRARYHFQLLGRKTVVYRNRLLYLARTGGRPEVVDHRNGDRRDDRPENLGPHTRAESDRQGRALQRERLARNAADYFNYIAFFGHEPPAGSLIDTGRGYT